MRLLMLTFCLSGLFFTQNLSAQYSWVELSTSPTALNINAVSFVDDLEGWIICDGGEIWHTDDGGNNWDERNFLSVTSDGYDIQFIDDTLGWACGDFGIIIYTINGGETWLPTFIGADHVFEDIHMVSPSDGIASGLDLATGDAVVFSTTDGGVSWNEITSAPWALAYYAADASNVDPSLIIAAGKDNMIIRSSNGGTSWSTATFTGGALPSPMGWEAIYMYDELVGYAVGWDEIFAVTVDGGFTWNVVPGSSPGMTYRDIEMFGDNNIVIVGTNGILWTEDAGSSGWMSTSFSVPVPLLEGIALVDGQTGYIVGDQGIIYRSPGVVDVNIVDLVIESYDGPVNVCGPGLFPVQVTVKNDGLSPATSADILVMDSGGSTLLTTSWSGVLNPGSTVSLNLGLISLNANETLEIEIFGDDYPDNNSFSQEINWMIPLGLGADSPIYACGNGGVELNAYGGLTYQWIQAKNISDSTIANPVVYPEETTTYVVGIDAAWCFGSFPVLVNYSHECFEQATVLTPNGDGANDAFYVEGAVPGADSEFYVFSRWGNQVMYLQGYDNESIVWKGKDYSEEELPTGTYYYVYDNLETGFQSKGWVQLLR